MHQVHQVIKKEIENHNIYGGLGSAVAEVLAENCPSAFRRVGVPDTFGEVGNKEFLADKFGISAKHIEKTVRELVLEKKKGQGD